jgi:lysophospholipase L1-like esterase
MTGRRIALAASAIAAALLAVEAGLRLFHPQPLLGPWLTTSERGYAINRASTIATHAIADRSVRYRINSLGFRGAEPEFSGKRVLVVGDSVTFGLFLDEPDAYVSRLASNAAAQFGAGQLEFMNAAVGGWGTADYVAFIEDHGDALRPDAVLVFIGFDAVRRTWASPLWDVTADGTVQRRPVAELTRGIRRITEVPGYRFLIEHSHAAQLLRQVALRTPRANAKQSVPDDEVRDSLGLTKQLFARLSEWCRSRGVLLLVTNGTLLEFSATSPAENPTVTFLQDAEPFFAELAVPYLPVARAHGRLDHPLPELHIPEDGHPNEQGAAVILTAVWPWLRQHLTGLLERSAPRFRS